MVKYGFPLGAFLGLIALFTIFRLCFSDEVFNESFKEPFEKRWNDGYEGVPKHAKTELDVRELGAKGRFVVLQFEIRLGKGLECGGADLKYLTLQKGEWKLEEFDSSSCSIMFGLDKCGDKVHFALKQKNPRSGEYVEHHLKSLPTVPSDKLSHVYTAILKPNSDLVILIDGKQKKLANLMNRDDFEPPCILPAKTISDPDNKKHEDGDKGAKIPYLETVKPYGGTKSCTARDYIKKKILDLLSKLVDLLKKCKYDVKLTHHPQTTVVSVTICYEQFCFFTLTYERKSTT